MARKGKEARQKRWLICSRVHQWAFHLRTAEDPGFLLRDKCVPLVGLDTALFGDIEWTQLTCFYPNWLTKDATLDPEKTYARKVSLEQEEVALKDTPEII